MQGVPFCCMLTFFEHKLCANLSRNYFFPFPDIWVRKILIKSYKHFQKNLYPIFPQRVCNVSKNLAEMQCYEMHYRVFKKHGIFKMPQFVKNPVKQSQTCLSQAHIFQSERPNWCQNSSGEQEKKNLVKIPEILRKSDTLGGNKQD